MPGWNECSIYDEKCRNKTCDHPTNKSRATVPTPQRLMDIVTDKGIPFRVAYGRRQYRGGSYSPTPVVSFYDARYDFDGHGQFVSDYGLETLLERQRGYPLDLQGDVPNWTIDAASMDLVRSWLINQVRV